MGKHLRERTYFNKQFFTRVILQEPGVSRLNQNYLLSRRAIFFRHFFAALCLGALALFWIHHAKDSDSLRVLKVKQQLAQKQWFYQPPYTDTRMKYMNEDLNRMYKAMQAYPKHMSLLSLNNLTLHSTRLHNTLKENYENALKHKLLWHFGATLAQDITAPEHRENDRLEILRVIAMMQNKQHRDIGFTTGWATKLLEAAGHQQQY